MVFVDCLASIWGSIRDGPANYCFDIDVSLNVPIHIYGFRPAVVVLDSESYTCDSIILLSGLGYKVLFVALGLSLSHKRGEPSTT
jgi:hypothetical protein